MVSHYHNPFCIAVDLPTILSGNRLAYLDPHEEIWPKETGQWYDIDKNTDCSDTFAPFNNLCGFTSHTGYYHGTLFRFPLRNVRREKGVSHYLCDFNKLHALLPALREEAKCILLFLRSVRSAQVTGISGNGAHFHLLKVSIRETSSDQLGHKRQQFQQSLERLFNAQSYGIRETLSLVVHVQVEVNDYQDATQNSTSKWLVVNRVGTQCSEARKAANELKVFPWVGVALETSLEQIEHGGGRVFCVLPMPLEVSCNLPVHVNGTFSLNDERRELKWQGVERKNDQSAQWNHLLVTQLLPPYYASLLLDHAKMLLQPKQFCRAWPNTRKVRGTHWERLLTPILNALFAQQVIPFCRPGSLGIVSWTKVSSATFVPRGSILPTAVTTALVTCGVKLVTVPDVVWNALEHCKIAVNSVSPSLTRCSLRASPQSYSGFSPRDKHSLLQYCLYDNAYGDLYNLALLPLANGQFATFSVQSHCSKPVYLCSPQCPRYLLPNLDGELVDNDDIEHQLYLKLKATAEGRYTNLKVLTVNDVATLLPRSIPQQWQYQNIVAMPHSTFNMQWFERFWRWVAGESLNLFSNQFVIPVFNSQTQMHSLTRLSLTSPSLFIPSTQTCDPSLLSALGKLGVKCCLQKTYPFIRHISYLSALMHFFSSNGVVDAITCASPSFNSISLTKEEAKQLRTQVHNVSVSTPRLATLRNLPMFLTLGNTGERLYSVTQVEHSTSGVTQMEPLNFPLSAENLPSNVILFSSSDYYQRMLLQSLSVRCTTTVDLLFGQHEELTRRIQNIIRDYPFDMTILKELLQNADDAKASKMHVILDMRKHSSEHLLSDTWKDLQGPALLVWNDSVFSDSDLKGIQRLGLGSKRSDSETIGQYGIGFNAVYHLTDCPSFLTGGNTLCILDPHMRYVPQATDRHPGAMYANLDDRFWNYFDGIKSTYLQDCVTNRPKELLGGSLFRFPLRHTLALVKESNIVKDLEGQSFDRVISSQKMYQLLEDWAPKMKQSLLFLNNVMELKFYVIRDRRGVFELLNSYRTELNEDALKSRSELVQKIRDFANVETRDPHIATYPLTIVESRMKKGKDHSEEWLIQQGIGDSQKKVEVWSYVEQVKPRHGIAAPLKRDTSHFRGQVFHFLRTLDCLFTSMVTSFSTPLVVTCGHPQILR